MSTIQIKKNNSSMKYSKKFKEESDFISFFNSDEYINPNVSYSTRERKLHINEGHFLNFTALQDNSKVYIVKFGNPQQINVQYSMDKNNWSKYKWEENETLVKGEEIILASGETVYFKGKNSTFSESINSDVYEFKFTGKIAADGDVTSLLNGVGGNVRIPDYCFNRLFLGCDALVQAPNLPSKIVGAYGYYEMFKDAMGDSILKTMKSIPAETIGDYGCCKMFESSYIDTIPELPAETLGVSAYENMFYGAYSVEHGPKILPAKVLSENCYKGMFYMNHLTKAPILPAKELVSGCYTGMFGYCWDLNYIEAMFTTEPSSAYTQNWVANVASGGTFVKSSEATWNVVGVNGIPSGWTVTTK